MTVDGIIIGNVITCTINLLSQDSAPLGRWLTIEEPIILSLLSMNIYLVECILPVEKPGPSTERYMGAWRATQCLDLDLVITWHLATPPCTSRYWVPVSPQEVYTPPNIYS